MEKELTEFVDALRDLKSAVLDLKASSLQTRDALGRVVSDSHLRSTFTLLREDIGFRRVLDLTHV